MELHFSEAQDYVAADQFVVPSGAEETTDWTGLFTDDDACASATLHYEMNFVCKELLLICQYYASLRLPGTEHLASCSRRTTKQQLVSHIVAFESDPAHAEVVERRQRLWFYMAELHNDKFLANYVHGPFFRR